MRAKNTEECLKKVKRAIELYERARASPNSITVTELAKKISSPRSHKSSAKAGIKAHNVWGDPLQACSHDEYWTPLPLAYELEDVWIYGIANLVRFQRGMPIEVVELKHYAKADKNAEAQVLIYAWLVSRLFGITPKVRLVLGWNGRKYTANLEVDYSVALIEKELRKTLGLLVK